MSDWKIQNDENNCSAESNLATFKTESSWAGGLSGQWRELNIASLDALIRTGSTYDLYSCNQLIDCLKTECQKTEISEDENAIRLAIESTARDIVVRNQIEIDHASREISFKPLISKNGFGKERYQIIFNGVLPLAENNYCFILPSLNGLVYRRPFEPSGQKIMDQDHMQFFPKTERLDLKKFIICSVKNKKSILVEGDNLKFLSCYMAPNMGEAICFSAYGGYIELEREQKYQDALKFRMIDGLGGFKSDLQDADAGIGALLERQYATKEGQVKVYFSAPEEILKTEATLSGKNGVMRRKEGKGALEMDISGLDDGEYTVRKELLLANKRIHSSTENLLILKKQYAALEKRISDIKNFRESLKDESELIMLRKNSISFKLEDTEKYLKFKETAQADALLKDAERIIAAINKNEKAEIPENKKLFYEHPFRSNCADFQYYGNGEIIFTEEKGLYIEPHPTVNMWSKFKLKGSFCVEFDYHPFVGRGGTMVQLCGNHTNPVNDHSMMCSATGYMPHYNFGINCYHFSFCRGQKITGKPQICNFRKTGSGFYVLDRIDDPAPCENENWRKLTFVKNNRQFLFFVDGNLVQECFDEGNNGPFLGGGRLGIRNWSGRKSYFKDLKIFIDSND